MTRASRRRGAWRARLLALAAGLLLCGTLPAHAQQPDELGRVKVAFPGAAGERIVVLIREAGEEGLPTSLLVNKVLEGIEKRQPADRVLRTVTEYARELREARAAVGREVGDEALKEAADALRRGVPASSIRSLARSARGELEILFVVMFDLMDDGVPPGPAEALVEDAVRHGVEGDRLLSLPGSVRQLIRSGLEPGEAADSVRREVTGGTVRVPTGRGRGPLVGGWSDGPPWWGARPRPSFGGGAP